MLCLERRRRKVGEPGAKRQSGRQGCLEPSRGLKDKLDPQTQLMISGLSPYRQASASVGGEEYIMRHGLTDQI